MEIQWLLLYLLNWTSKLASKPLRSIHTEQKKSEQGTKKASAKAKKSKEKSEEIKEKISNIKEYFRFCICFCLVWTDP